MKKVLITGANGFTGRYLAQALAQRGCEVHGLANGDEQASVPGVARMHAGNLLDAARLAEVIAEVQPQQVVHLAAIAFVAHGDIEAIYRTNVVGTRNLLDAVARQAPDVESVLVASSANIYGNAVEGMLDESVAPDPANDYAVSKLSTEFVARLYMQRLPIVLVRPFNYTGVGQSESFLIPKIVSHARRGAEQIELGNLDVARDFSDVRVVVDYYRRLLSTPEAAGRTFNVCSGRVHTLREVLAMVRALSGQALPVVVNPAFVRANEVRTLAGNPGLLNSVVGEPAAIALEDTLAWMLRG